MTQRYDDTPHGSLSDEMAELAAGYALGALSAEDAALVERSLAGSEALAAEIAAYQDTVAMMAELEEITPPPAVRERLLRRIRESDPVVVATLPPARERQRGRWGATYGLGAALAASIAGLVWMSSENSTLRTASGTADAKIAALGEKLEHREHTLNSLLFAEKDLHVVHLKAADTVKGPGIQFFWNAKQGVGVAHAFRLTPAPAGQSYQLWLMVRGKPWSAKVFNSDPDGHALVEGLTLPESMAGVTDVVVTVEPASGSTAPTGVAVMAGSMAEPQVPAEHRH